MLRRATKLRFSVVAGCDIDTNSVAHGFLRTADGTITPFDAPEAGTGSGQGTYAQSINDFGVITGFYVDSNGTLHGFLRQ
ncbi:MAG: hypothetical protein WCA91_20025 [Candidatus Acidiferrales bacterium]